MRIRIDRDLGAGLLFLACGVFFAIAARDYRIGTPARMGPGYFPQAVGIIVATLGALLVARGFVHRLREAATLELGPLAILILALVLFALVAPDGGIALAVVILVVVSAFAGGTARWREIAATAVFLAAFTVVVFVSMLGLPLRVWPAW